MRLFPLALAAVIVMLTSALALADGFIIIEPPYPIIVPPPHPRPIPWPHPRPHYVFAPLSVESHHVTCTITDQVAVTEVDQSFYNPNDQRLEGTYLFPIPAGARIDKFSMDVGGKMVEAELLDATKARQIYEDIVRRAKDPALLEYAGQGALKARIFPIEPHSSKKIKLKYTELLRSDNGMVGYTYPLNTEKFSSTPIKSVSVKVEVRTKRPLASIYCPSHKAEIKHQGEDRAVVGYEANDTKPDTDFKLFFSTQKDKDDLGLSLLTYKDGESSDGYFLLLVSPPPAPKSDQIARKDVVFVLDTSGSMVGEKIEQAKRALKFCVNSLNDGDRFELIRFATEAEPLFDGLVDANRANRDKAETFIKDLKAIGGTAIDDALTQAIKTVKDRRMAGADRPAVIIFLTDGRPTIGTTDEQQIVDRVKKTTGDSTIRIFCFGIGTDINTHLLDKITDSTRAASQYVLPDEDLEVKVSNFYGKISNPVMAEPKLSFSGRVKVSKLHPSPLPDLFQGDQLMLLGRYSGDGDAAITLEGTVAGKSRKVTFEGPFTAKSTEHDFVPRLWATRRVGFLLDEIRLHGESGELKDEVTQLARQYGIVTPYTAYLIVEDEDRRAVPMTARTLQAPARDREAQLALRESYHQFGAAKSGGQAVGGAQATDALRRAEAPAAAPGAANEMAWRGLKDSGIRGADQAGKMVTEAQQQQRFVAGRNFYQNGDLWVDAKVQNAQQARKVQVKFGSDDYFALIKKHPEAAQWLSLGTNVQVLLGETVYEVAE